MRPIQIWIPDTRRAGFAEEARRQSREVAAADRADPALDVFLDAALENLYGPPADRLRTFSDVGRR